MINKSYQIKRLTSQKSIIENYNRNYDENRTYKYFIYTYSILFKIETGKNAFSNKYLKWIFEIINIYIKKKAASINRVHREFVISIYVFYKL